MELTITIEKLQNYIKLNKNIGLIIVNYVDYRIESIKKIKGNKILITLSDKGLIDPLLIDGTIKILDLIVKSYHLGYDGFYILKTETKLIKLFHKQMTPNFLITWNNDKICYMINDKSSNSDKTCITLNSLPGILI